MKQKERLYHKKEYMPRNIKIIVAQETQSRLFSLVP